MHIDTPVWEPTPTVVEVTSFALTRDASTHIVVAGDALGTAGWIVDNFILFEVFDCTGARVDAALTGWTGGERVTLDGAPVRRIGRDAFEYVAGEVVLDSLAPPAVPVVIHATTLDYGDHVLLTEVYLLSR